MTIRELKTLLTSPSPSVVVALIFGIIGVTGIVLQRLLRFEHDVREPPVVSSRIPFIGHILGMLRNGTAYIDMLCETYGHSIFTLPMMTGRLYVVTSPHLVSLVQRGSKTLAFEPIVLELADRIASVDPGARELIANGYDPTEKDSDKSLLLHMHHFHIGELGPGPWLEGLSFDQLNHLAQMLQDTGNGEGIELFSWIRHLVSASNMLSAYGPKNVFLEHPELEDDFWEFENDLPLLMGNFLPSLMARRAYFARERVTKGLIEWSEKANYTSASHWIQNRYKINREHGLSVRQAGQVELGMMFGLLANAMPTTFWVMAHLITEPKLLHELRQELETANLVRTDGTNRIIKIDGLKTDCPLLASIFRETLRMYAPMAGARLVLEDTVVGDQYLLKKGSVIQMAGGAIHKDARIWGPDSHEFNPYRFLHSTNGSVPAPKARDDENVRDSKVVHPAAFRGFGGGTSRCPGRHFAQTEIYGFVAVLALGFDFLPVDDAKFVLPGTKKTLIPVSALKPDQEIRVRMRRRIGMEDVQWSFEN